MFLDVAVLIRRALCSAGSPWSAPGSEVCSLSLLILCSGHREDQTLKGESGSPLGSRMYLYELKGQSLSGQF